MKKTRVVLFGAGIIGREVFPKLAEHIQVVAFTDNDPAKHGSKISGIDIVSPDMLSTLDYDLILISSSAIADIFNQLIGLGVAEEKIVVLSDAEKGAPEFPWDAVIFLVVCILAAFALLIYFLIL